jgi:limonene-1,2-epoxide hydrolase
MSHPHPVKVIATAVRAALFLPMAGPARILSVEQGYEGCEGHGFPGVNGMTTDTDMKDTVLEFVERINAHDVDGILDLMSDDYRFINSAGDAFRGKAFMRATWKAHFVQYPDFNIRIDRVLSDSGAVGLFGMASGTLTRDGQILDENHWEIPSAFLGIARGGKMVHWQVFSDTSMVFDLIKANE